MSCYLDTSFQFPSLQTKVMPILPVSRIFTDDELDEHQLGSLKSFGGGTVDGRNPIPLDR